MAKEQTALHKRIESGKQILLAEISPPTGSDSSVLIATATRYAGKVHALGISDNRHGVCMSALAAASLVAAQGVEPILHVVTRDRNQIALIADCLGADALGIRNVLCTSGTHQTLGRCRAAKNVFDIDSVQLIRAISGLAQNGTVVGEEGFDNAGPFCLGGVAAPYADPVELQVMRLVKKVDAGVHFLVTQPVFDLERFNAWWNEIVRLEVHQKVAILAGIRLLGNTEQAKAFAVERPDPAVPESVLQRLASKPGPDAQRSEAIAVALETIRQLSGLEGLRGFEIDGAGDDDAALEVIQKSGLGVD
ncbi:MAG TPA: methylenetetrahydrofolate reductase [bacterium]|nr:methylenetetrahydrofolate reductase [bacterium]